MNYSFRVADTVEVFVHPQVYNVFNNQGVIAVDTTVLSAANSARLSTLQPVHCATLSRACELGLRLRFRQAAERRGLPDPALLPGLGRRALLRFLARETSVRSPDPPFTAREKVDDERLGPVGGRETVRGDETDVSS